MRALQMRAGWIALGLLSIVVVDSNSRAHAQVEILERVGFGLPDLAVQVSASPKDIKSGASASGVYQDAVVLITVENRLSAASNQRRPQEAQAPKVVGSDVGNVLFQVNLSPGLRRVGIVSIPNGFQCSAMQELILCFGAIEAGRMVEMRMGVIADARTSPPCWYDGRITVEVDPNKVISETSEDNNRSEATISVSPYAHDPVCTVLENPGLGSVPPLPTLASGEVCARLREDRSAIDQIGECGSGLMCAPRRTRTCESWWIFRTCFWIVTTDSFCD